MIVNNELHFVQSFVSMMTLSTLIISDLFGGHVELELPLHRHDPFDLPALQIFGYGLIDGGNLAPGFRFIDELVQALFIEGYGGSHG